MNENELIFKYLANELTVEEKEIFNAALENDKAFSEEVRQYTSIWNEVPILETELEVDEDDQWDKLQSKLGWDNESAEEVVDVIAISKPRNYWMRIAAVITLTVSASVLYLLKEKVFTDQTIDQVIVSNSVDSKTLKHVTLPDGSRVTLKPGAEITYQDMGSSIDQRNLSLSGKAFFDIARDEQKPFVISTVAGTAVTVLGTSFSVESGINETQVSVWTGKVRVENVRLNKSTEIVKGQQAIDNGNHIVRNDAFDMNSLAWSTGVLKFEASDLPYVLNTINEHYGVNIIPENRAFDKCKITTSLDNQELSSVMEILSGILSASIEKRGDKYILTGKGC